MAHPPSKTPNPMLEASPTALTSDEDSFYWPRPQSYWYHEETTWIPVPPDSSSAPNLPVNLPSMNPQTIRLLSWNIDILSPFIEERMAAALNYLHTLITPLPADIPTILFLQEMGESDLQQIRDASWIQERFYITELDNRNWEGPYYGTQTLIDRRLRIQSVFRVQWFSEFDRDGLFVDVCLSKGTAQKEEMGILRLCNTHMESLVADPPVRPLQFSSASKYLHSPNVAAALLAGDLNAIQPFDRTLHSDNNLQDAYLSLGGQEDSHDGYTWGYHVSQALKDRFGPSRMDKILFTGAVKTQEFERIGIDVKVAEEKRKEVKDAGELEWVTDHYGVMGVFELEGWRMVGVGGQGLQSPATAKLS